ncbi:hypothetical protein ABZX40_26105 [Streptomyces sp. NPDC004610]|uniref:hypothetical protein n=1 Tax=unclassified Streptomyces TaxID=2593676 RepID=UPI0033A6D3AD
MSRRHQEPPVVLGLPLPPPDCRHCAGLMHERAQAIAEHDGSRATDLTVLIDRHHPLAAGSRTTR